MAIRLENLDIYALVDSDTDEARIFTTYLGYWSCLAAQIERTFGRDPTTALVADLRERKAFKKAVLEARSVRLESPAQPSPERLDE